MDVQQKEQVDFVVKVAALGQLGIGKSSFIRRHFQDTFSDQPLMTIKIDFFVKTITHKDKRERMRLFDLEPPGTQHGIQNPLAIEVLLVLSFSSVSLFSFFFPESQQVDQGLGGERSCRNTGCLGGHQV